MKKDLKAKRIKVIVDINIFISALIGSKNCKEIYNLFKSDKFDILISPDLFDEYKRVTTWGKFKKFINEELCKKLLNLIRNDSEKVLPKENVSVCRDPKDNIVLECAMAGKPDFIVTGDKDLLSLKKFKSISIISPKEFVRLVR